MNAVLEFSWEHFKNSPSRDDGITAERERVLRMETCAFIDRLVKCKYFKQPTRSRKTKKIENKGIPGRVSVISMAYFHQFYFRNSFAKCDRWEIAVACVALAAKSKSCLRPLKRIVAAAIRLWRDDMNRAEVEKAHFLEVRLAQDKYKKAMIKWKAQVNRIAAKFPDAPRPDVVQPPKKPRLYNPLTDHPTAKRRIAREKALEAQRQRMHQLEQQRQQQQQQRRNLNRNMHMYPTGSRPGAGGGAGGMRNPRMGMAMGTGGMMNRGGMGMGRGLGRDRRPPNPYRGHGPPQYATGSSMAHLNQANRRGGRGGMGMPMGANMRMGMNNRMGMGRGMGRGGARMMGRGRGGVPPFSGQYVRQMQMQSQMSRQTQMQMQMRQKAKPKPKPKPRWPKKPRFIDPHQDRVCFWRKKIYEREIEVLAALHGELRIETPYRFMHPRRFRDAQILVKGHDILRKLLQTMIANVRIAYRSVIICFYCPNWVACACLHLTMRQLNAAARAAAAAVASSSSSAATSNSNSASTTAKPRAVAVELVPNWWRNPYFGVFGPQTGFGLDMILFMENEILSCMSKEEQQGLTPTPNKYTKAKAEAALARSRSLSASPTSASLLSKSASPQAQTQSQPQTQPRSPVHVQSSTRRTLGRGRGQIGRGRGGSAAKGGAKARPLGRGRGVPRRMSTNTNTHTNPNTRVTSQTSRRGRPAAPGSGQRPRVARKRALHEISGHERAPILQTPSNLKSHSQSHSNTAEQQPRTLGRGRGRIRPRSRPGGARSSASVSAPTSVSRSGDKDFVFAKPRPKPPGYMMYNARDGSTAATTIRTPNSSSQGSSSSNAARDLTISPISDL